MLLIANNNKKELLKYNFIVSLVAVTVSVYVMHFAFYSPSIVML